MLCKKYLICAAFFSVMFLHGCGAEIETVVADVDPRGWEPNKEYSLVFKNGDISSPRNISIFAVHEHNVHERLDSIPLIVTTVTPDSVRFSERWVLHTDLSTGPKIVKYEETKRVYRTDVVLGHYGQYGFSFGQDSGETLKGIRAVGVEIKRAPKKKERE